VAGTPLDVSAVRYAGVPERMVAYAVDIALVVMASMAVGTLLAFAVLGAPWWLAPWSQPAARELPGNIERYLLYQVINEAVALAIEVVYFVWLWTGRAGATCGMRVVRIRVADAASGQPIARAAALRRWVTMGSWIIVLVLLPGTLGDLAVLVFLAWLVLMVLVTMRSPTRQGLHDRFAGTVVLEPVTRPAHPLALGCLALAGLVLALVAALGVAGFWNA
jgi:uncharacterized RDD family membrane protein YckC